MGERLILVGRVEGAFGVRGEIRIRPFTQEPAALLRYAPLLGSDGAAALTLTEGRVHGRAVVARAAEIGTREEAEALRGFDIFAPRSAFPPPEEDEFYLADLIGLEAVDPERRRLGRVKSAQNFGAGDVLEIQPDAGPSWWLPFTREAVPDVRLAEGTLVVVRPPES